LSLVGLFKIDTSGRRQAIIKMKLERTPALFD
jgi:hypothetical protein